jgi:hypothetical protein
VQRDDAADIEADAAMDDGADIEVEPDDMDIEAVSDELDPPGSLADAPGLGLDLPEADTLDQRRIEPLDEDEQR